MFAIGTREMDHSCGTSLMCRVPTSLHAEFVATPVDQQPMHASEPVNRFMSEAVLAIDVNSSVGEILRYFMEYPVHHLPVVQDRKVVGMVSSADVLKLKGFLPRAGGDPVDFLNRRLRIDQVMRRPPITIGPRDSLEKAASLMATHGIHALPVVSGLEDHLIGIITTTDIMNAALRLERQGAMATANANPAIKLPRMTAAEMAHALSIAAERLSASNESGELSRALMQTNSRIKVLEEVLACATRYVRGGQDDRLHATLVKAIDTAREESTGHELSL